jgi:glutamate synthase (NADPH/NADH) small chain
LGGGARNLHSTNNFPEFTGRVCPAPCEEACTLNLENQPVTIKTIEQAIADKAWEMGWVKPSAGELTGKRVAVIGSGRRMAAAPAARPRRPRGPCVRARAKPGGLLRYGIPDFKMEKHHIDRRVAQMEAEGVVFHYGVEVGGPRASPRCTTSSTPCCSPAAPRSRAIRSCPGQDLQGVHYAMPYLTQQNRRVSGESFDDSAPVMAAGSHVVVIGGGDTASDCVGTAFRQGALSVTQLDIRPKPPEQEDKLTVWPYWPTKLRTSSSQAEGAEREFQAATLRIEGKKGRVSGVVCARVDERRQPIPAPSSPSRPTSSSWPSASPGR